MASDKDVDIVVGTKLLAAAFWMVPVSSKLLVGVTLIDPASNVLGLSTGKELEIDSRTVEDKIEFVDTTRDDSIWRTLEVTPLLSNNVVRKAAVEIIWLCLKAQSWSASLMEQSLWLPRKASAQMWLRH
jgi:hypothetical protein